MARQAHIVDFEEARNASRRSGARNRSREAAGASSRLSSNREARSRAIRGGEVAGARRGSHYAQRNQTRTRAGQSAQRGRTRGDKRTQRNIAESVCKLQRDARKRKADRAFDRTVGASSSASGESGPRAAVYRGKMGSTHRKSSRMRNDQEAASRGVAPSRGRAAQTGRVIAGAIPRFVRIPLVLFAALALCVAALYQPMQDYYIATRDQAKAAAQLEVLSQQNAQLQKDVAVLSTDEGIKDQAALDYGWVEQGETAVAVSGVSAEDTELDSAVMVVSATAVSAPATWYSGMLDPFFGYSG